MPFKFTDRGIPRQGCPIVVGGEAVGAVTSGTLSPCLGVGIGMGYVPPEVAEQGTEIEIDVSGKQRPARVESKPLYQKGGQA